MLAIGVPEMDEVDLGIEWKKQQRVRCHRMLSVVEELGRG
jgi:hypothetical protein